MSVLEVCGVTRRFGDLLAVDEVSFAIEKGSIFGFIGPNGAGKTTTRRIVATLDHATAGDVRVEGCILTNSRRQGISITHADGVTIDGCSITDINGVPPQFGIDVETNDAAYPVRNVKVRDCTFRGSVGGGFIAGQPSSGVAITGCTFDGNLIALGKSQDATITGCHVTGADIILGGHRIAASGNTLTGGRCQIYAEFPTSDVAITGNVLTAAGVETSALMIHGGQVSHRVTFVGNTISGYPTPVTVFRQPVDSVIQDNAPAP